MSLRTRLHRDALEVRFVVLKEELNPNSLDKVTAITLNT